MDKPHILPIAVGEAIFIQPLANGSFVVQAQGHSGTFRYVGAFTNSLDMHTAMVAAFPVDRDTPVPAPTFCVCDL